MGALTCSPRREVTTPQDEDGEIAKCPERDVDGALKKCAAEGAWCRTGIQAELPMTRFISAFDLIMNFTISFCFHLPPDFTTGGFCEMFLPARAKK
jgi:hypothetical protein